MEKTTRHVAIAQCVCGKYICSTGGGRFRKCECGKSYIDQERWGALYARVGGNAKLIEVVCPSTCEYREHKNGVGQSVLCHTGSKLIEDFAELKKYFKKTYKVNLLKV